MKKIAVDRICATPLSQAIGLMFSRRRTLLFVFRRPRRMRIHSWFVFFPLTLLFLDSSRRVIESTRLRPFSYYAAQRNASYLIETPHTITIRDGERMVWQPQNSGRIR